MSTATKRKVFHVVPAPKGWAVMAEGSLDKETYTTKLLAIEHAKNLAKEEALAQVKIHKQDGTFETEYTYGADPRHISG